MPTSLMTSSARVIVAHKCPVLAAGLMTSLRRLPNCEVELCEETALAGPAIDALGARIVIADRAFVAAILERRARSSTPAPRLVIVVSSPDDDDASDGPALPDGVDASLTVPCAEQEFFALMRRLSGARACGSAKGGLAPGALGRVLAKIERNLEEGVALADLARPTGLSEGHFSRAFKRSVGLPPHRYLLQRRVAAAARLLGEDGQSLTDIALSLGFCDQSLFTRHFAAHTGVTPGAYRRALRTRREAEL